MPQQEEFRSRSAFLFAAPDGIFDEVNALEAQAGVLLAILLAFKSNISAALEVGNIPFQLVSRAVYQAELRGIFLAERIRARSFGDADTPRIEKARDAIAREKTDERLRATSGDMETAKKRAENALYILDGHLEDPKFDASAMELLRQILVMAWSAFEVLVNDTFRQLLNKRPRLVAAMARSRGSREIFTERRLLDALQESEFNLSASMGDFFCESVRLDSLEKIREAIHVCFDNGDLDTLLKDEGLWRLSQQRHLIVHRRGLVDNRYIEKTGDTLRVGEHLKVNACYVESCMDLVLKAGCAFYRVAAETANA